MTLLRLERVCAIAATLATAAWLGGCAGAPKPAEVAGSIQAAGDVNPSTSRRPSPIVVRVYELKSVAAFDKSDFMSLYQRDQAELAADLVGKEEFVLAPGETKTFAKKLSPDTRFIGVVAAFRDVERSRWRSTVPIEPGKKHTVTIRASALAVDASVAR